MKKCLLRGSNNLQVSAIALSSVMYQLTLLAENAALRKANAIKENVAPTIPRPENGSASKGFNLQDKMGLADNDELYGALRVS
jgi:hypothetical protein